ncbi:rhodanese-like domain-containing protein [Amycolatopsis echigonensis]|uniref:Rhodanese-like domain-containing protein n=1 Tax=Amycolatopsis echigonensis TaxID=2576905 RepID=A0A8E1VSZ7_9PSEU|nr:MULTISPECIES: rhodanese-like domain-containing protein [Amycolatopsis]MBB2497929.1 rhodanese-like domain-containing protein [Amycolatopsis echigonensis]
MEPVVSPAEIPTAEVRDLPADVALLDVREDDEWAAGHAPAAVHIPLGELPARVGELAEFPEDNPVYVICRSGGRSARATAWLNASGWDAVNVAGGMGAWAREGRRMVSDNPDAEPEVL